MIIQILSISGFILSVYALYVKHRSKEKGYRPRCDISEHISCTKAFNSRYSSLIFFPNMLYGLLYYAAALFLYYVQPKLIFFISVPAVLMSVFLAGISYFRLKNFCVICTSTYMINITMLVVSYLFF